MKEDGIDTKINVWKKLLFVQFLAVNAKGVRKLWRNETKIYLRSKFKIDVC